MIGYLPFGSQTTTSENIESRISTLPNRGAFLELNRYIFKKLGANAALVYSVLGKYMLKWHDVCEYNNWWFPYSTTALCKNTDLHVRMVRYAVEKLEKYGLLEVAYQKNGNHKKCYRIVHVKVKNGELVLDKECFERMGIPHDKKFVNIKPLPYIEEVFWETGEFVIPEEDGVSAIVQIKDANSLVTAKNGELRKNAVPANDAKIGIVKIKGTNSLEIVENGGTEQRKLNTAKIPRRRSIPGSQKYGFLANDAKNGILQKREDGEFFYNQDTEFKGEKANSPIEKSGVLAPTKCLEFKDDGEDDTRACTATPARIKNIYTNKKIKNKNNNPQGGASRSPSGELEDIKSKTPILCSDAQRPSECYNLENIGESRSPKLDKYANHGALLTKSSSGRPKVVPFSPTQRELQYTELFLQKVLENFPNLSVDAQNKIRKNGPQSLRKLVKKFGSFQIVRKVIEWGMQDSFWKKQIRSIAALLNYSKSSPEFTKFEMIKIGYDQKNIEPEEELYNNLKSMAKSQADNAEDAELIMEDIEWFKYEVENINRNKSVRLGWTKSNKMLQVLKWLHLIESRLIPGCQYETWRDVVDDYLEYLNRFVCNAPDKPLYAGYFDPKCTSFQNFIAFVEKQHDIEWIHI